MPYLTQVTEDVANGEYTSAKYKMSATIVHRLTDTLICKPIQINSLMAKMVKYFRKKKEIK